METSLWAALTVVIATLIGSVGALFLKYGANKLSRDLRKLVKNHDLFMGVLCYGVSTVIFIVALRFGDLSVLYPITSLTYVWIALLSVKYLNEKMNFFKYAGIFSILVGVTLIGLGS